MIRSPAHAPHIHRVHGTATARLRACRHRHPSCTLHRTSDEAPDRRVRHPLCPLTPGLPDASLHRERSKPHPFTQYSYRSRSRAGMIGSPEHTHAPHIHRVHGTATARLRACRHRHPSCTLHRPSYEAPHRRHRHPLCPLTTCEGSPPCVGVVVGTRVIPSKDGHARGTCRCSVLWTQPTQKYRVYTVCLGKTC